MCSDEQHVDIFTKPLCKAKLCHLRDEMGTKSINVVNSSYLLIVSVHSF